VRMRLKDVNEIIVDEIERIASTYPGKCALKLSVLGAHEDRAIQLEMLSRKFSVDLTDQFMTEIKTMNELDVHVLVK